MDHKAAIETQNRNARIASASTADDKKLAEVEQAVIASKTALVDEEAKMRADGIYADGYIDDHIAQRKVQSIAYIDKLKADIVDPIAERIEFVAKATAFEMPERTAIHIEASQHYTALDSDRRQEAISRAITGKDDVLAVALLTAPGDPITDITREQLMKRLAPSNDNREQIMSMAKRVQATLNTINGARK